MRKKFIWPLFISIGLLSACGTTESKYEDLSDEELLSLMMTKLTKDGQAFEEILWFGRRCFEGSD